MTAKEKIKFLQYTFIQKLREVEPETKPIFGKMNVHQMIEHFIYAVQVASGKIAVSAINEGEKAEKSYRWMMDLETSFKDNTPNPLLPDEPLKPTTPSIGDAIDNLEDELQDFLDIYKNEPGKKVLNAFFGELDYYEQVQLLYKHANHHTRQFAL